LKLSHRIGISLAAFLGIVLLAGAIKGCASTKLPRKLSEVQRSELQTVHLPSVGVERYKWPGHSEALVQALIRTRLFENVAYIDQCSETPQLIARVEDPISGSAVTPVFTGITLGFFPTWTRETHGNSFSLSSSSTADEKISIDFRYSGYTILGWVAGLCNMLLPDRTEHDVAQHPQYAEALGYAIAQKKDQIYKSLGW